MRHTPRPQRAPPRALRMEGDDLGDPMVDVVIVSSREDEKLVRPIAERATSLGLEVWRSDSTSDRDGAHDKDICAAQIGRSGVVLVCWSDRAVVSKSVLAEASDALWQQKLVACRLSPCDLPSPFELDPGQGLCRRGGVHRSFGIDRDSGRGRRKTAPAGARRVTASP